MKFLDELKWRGLVKDVTDVEALEKQLEELRNSAKINF